MALPILFAGPTLHRARTIATTLPTEEYEVAPPVVRGSIADMTRSRPPGCAIIVDGLFHESLAVGHAEIRDAMAAGWTMWGLSSMGAIRAREMSSLGMRGFGRVFALYTQEGDFRDDEVALLHAPDPPYREISEPLVHIRAALDDLVALARCDSASRDAVLDQITRCWYGERTLAHLRELLARECADPLPWLDSWLAGFDRYRLKALDLIAFMTERPFRSVI